MGAAAVETYLPGFLAFLAAGGVVLGLAMLFGRGRDRLDERLRELSGDSRPGPARAPVALLARSALPKVAGPLLPGDEPQRTRLQTRLLHAGLYAPQAMVVYLAVKMALIFGPWLLGLAVGLTGLLPLHWAIAAGAAVGAVGLVGPGIWLDRRKADRQAILRAALPDVLDVLVICLEAGASLPAAFRRVAGELRPTYPRLGAELTIVQREMQLGVPIGEALQHFADRADLDEVRNLAGIVAQTERLGGGLVKALRVHSEVIRQKRMQRAEESCNKAATKVLLPTLFCIFPGIFIIILGPAAVQVADLMGKLKMERPAASAVEDPGKIADELPGPDPGR